MNITATTIYYNCDLPACTLQEWIDTSGGSGDFNNLLNDARATNTRHLLSLHRQYLHRDMSQVNSLTITEDAFMFHQANLRQTDVPSSTVGNQSGKLSLLQIWVETVMQEMIRLTNWPILTAKHDDLATQFVQRMTREYVITSHN
jgi:hypothetical protein